MEIREVLAFNLRKQRAERGWSQEELAHRADINRTYISDIERSRYSATIDVVHKLAVGLNVEAADLLRVPTLGATRPRAIAAKPSKSRKSGNA